MHPSHTSLGGMGGGVETRILSTRWRTIRCQAGHATRRPGWPSVIPPRGSLACGSVACGSVASVSPPIASAPPPIASAPPPIGSSRSTGVCGSIACASRLSARLIACRSAGSADVVLAAERACADRRSAAESGAWSCECEWAESDGGRSRTSDTQSSPG